MITWLTFALESNSARSKAEDTQRRGAYEVMQYISTHMRRDAARGQVGDKAASSVQVLVMTWPAAGVPE